MAEWDDSIPEDEEELREEAERNARIDLAAQIDDVRSLLKERAFRDFVWRLLSRCGMYEVGFSTEHSVMAFAAGRREIGLGVIHELVQAEPAAYAKIQQEHAQNG